MENFLEVLKERVIARAASSRLQTFSYRKTPESSMGSDFPW